MTSAPRSFRTGYACAALGAAFAGLNASLARFLLDDGLSALRLTQLRCAVVVAVLGLGLALRWPHLLRIRAALLPQLAIVAVLGLALAQAAYFYAVTRVEIGVALVVQYTAPLLLLLWLRLRHGRAVARGLWACALVSLVGSALVVRAYDPGALDVRGLLAALGSALGLCIYLVGNERLGRREHPATLLFWTFAIALVAWCLVQPVWTFPTAPFDGPRDALLGLAVGVVGTLVPFALIVLAVRFVPAPRASIVLTSEVLFGAAFAFLIHDEVLGVVQLIGGAAVLGAVTWLQAQRANVEAEGAPERSPRPSGVAHRR